MIAGTRSIAFAHRVAVAGIMMPTEVVHLTAGRQYMTDELHALCLFALLGRELGGPMRLCNLTLAAMTEALARGWGGRDSRVVMLLEQERAGFRED
jgi:hypothetical protein